MASALTPEEREFADRFKRQYTAREASRAEQRESQVRALQAAHRQLQAERAARQQQDAPDPMRFPDEAPSVPAAPAESLALPNPNPYSGPSAAPSPAARVARAETTRAASNNFGRANARSDAEAAAWESMKDTDPTNPLGIPSAEALSLDVPAPKPKTGLDALPTPPAYSKAPKQEGRSPVRGWNLPESGTLPGEEQVTSMDVFKRLSPQERAAIQQKYESGSHADAESFEDYLGFKYGDLPPEAREAAMRAEYGSPNDLSPVAQARRAAGKPLPEGLKPGVYTPEQMRSMSRDVYNPEVPQTAHGGTFTFNADGSRSSRAPEEYRLKDAEKAAAYAGEGSFEHNRALGKAYGIDVSQYDGSRPEDRALLAADVAREKERHDSLGKKYDVVRTPMGGTRYKANPQKMRAAQAEQDLAMPPERKREFANTIAKRFAGMMTPEQLASLDTLVQTPDGFAQLRALNQQLTRQRDVEGMRSWRANQANYNLTQKMRNPNYAPGMAVRSLMEAVRSGDPTMQAAAYAIAGSQPGFQRSMDLATAQTIGASQLAQAQTYANARGATAAQPDPTLGAQWDREMGAALTGDPAGRYDRVRNLVARNPANQGMDPATIDAKTKDTIAAHEYRTNPNSPAVQNHMQMLRQQGEQPFMNFAVYQLGIDPAVARQMYNSGRFTFAGLATGLGSAPPSAWGGAPPQGPRS